MAGSTRFLGMGLRRLISRRDMGLEFLDVTGQVNIERIGSNVSGANGRQQDVYKITNNSSSCETRPSAGGGHDSGQHIESD